MGARLSGAAGGIGARGTGRSPGSARAHEPVDDGLGDPPSLLGPREARGRDGGGERGAVDEGHDGETTGVERGAQNVLAFAQGPVDALGPGAHVVALGTQTRLKRQRPRRDQCRDDSEVAERTLLLQALQVVGEEGCQAVGSRLLGIEHGEQVARLELPLLGEHGGQQVGFTGEMVIDGSARDPRIAGDVDERAPFPPVAREAVQGGAGDGLAGQRGIGGSSSHEIQTNMYV